MTCECLFCTVPCPHQATMQCPNCADEVCEECYYASHDFGRCVDNEE